jgi:hypothetical protein
LTLADIQTQNLRYLLNCNPRAELARRRLIEFVKYVRQGYQVNWHHELLCHYLDRFATGDIKRLMVFMPPQHGKELSHSTPILTTNGWVTHGELKVGDYVYGRDGKPKMVLALSEETLSEYDIKFTDGTIIQCHGNHEWIITRQRYPVEKKVNTKWLAEQNLWSGEYGKRGSRAIFQIDENVCISGQEIELPIDPYTLGAWLGDGTSSSNCLTHHASDIECINKINNHYPITAQNIHKGTGAIRTGFKSLYKHLKSNNLFNNKHIPEIYFTSSIQQRLELLAGLIDTDGYVYHKNGRVTFVNINKKLIEDVRKLVISLGCRTTICEFKPIKSTSGIQGKHKVYQLCFNPNFNIPVAIERKKLKKINPKIRKRGIVSVTKSINPEKGRCIQVEGGIYLAGPTLIPTHNSELVSRLLPAFLLGKNPKAKIVIASYSAHLSNGFNKDCQEFIDSTPYEHVFPGTKIGRSSSVREKDGKKWVRNSDLVQTIAHKGFLRSVGVGSPLTGTPMDFGIIDDPVKDSLEAQSSTYQQRNWLWFNEVFKTRMHNDSRILITQTRWDVNDLSGLLLKNMEEIEGSDKWVILNLPAIKTNNDFQEDPRLIGEALWESRHSLERLTEIRNTSLRTFQSLYQQNPQPTQAGGEYYKCFKMDKHVKDLTDKDKNGKPLFEGFKLHGNMPYNEDLPIHFTQDFNVNPYMACGLWQTKGKEVWKIGEITTVSPNNTTKGICNEFKRLFPAHKSGLFIYGDPAGMHEDTRSEKGWNDFRILQLELQTYRPTLRVATKAPSLVMRGNFINTCFESNFNGISIIFDTRCSKTIEDYINIKEDSDGGKVKTKAVDMSTGVSYERWGHLSDGDDYFLCQYFASDYSLYQTGNKTMVVTMGKSQSKNI